jgi:phosphatidylglycerol:prolipoprotein diacylglycerol transferase
VHPILVDIPTHLPLLGDITFPSFFTFLMIGYGFAIAITMREARRQGMDEARVYDLDLWMVFWGLVGSRVLHLIADGQWHDYVNLCKNPTLVEAVGAKVAVCQNAAQCGNEFLCDTVRHVCYPPRDCLAVFELWRGGFAFYGGLVFASVFGLWYAHKHKLGMLRFADIAAYAIPIGGFFGRLGCYLNGCCFGKRCSLALGAVFPHGSLAWSAQLKAGLITSADRALPVHPTQLYESFAYLLWFFLLYFVLRPRKRGHGELLGWFLLLSAITRFLIEFIRDDDRGIWWLGLSTSQLIALPLMAAATYLILRVRRPACLPLGNHAPGTA